tara:strand:- start:1019 stop:1312 length:294 start_codon:yes stop_codon:yes gene_type:complete
MRSYPIWNNVQACIYDSSKSYGAREKSETTVLVGSSNSNSHALVRHSTKKIITEEYIYFKFYVDDIKIKEMIFVNNNNKAGELLETNSFINQKTVQL